MNVSNFPHVTTGVWNSSTFVPVKGIINFYRENVQYNFITSFRLIETDYKNEIDGWESHNASQW